ncbi:hypothetical protein GCM10017714_30250 [Curtobacterium pusillum]|uniref:Phosphatase PAP2 family protein n=1 Tax=Curtobacterium pusillum TaxID=69373 RepID=A0ABX2M669_9MICO|nr:phosphatase PAP2 family protein [Curtobacterium pusillum]NUU13590.1 phosphatase PAP2 family protein [Curtobacterium pusillum]GLK32178.1 hypothetical protein GCM10017610_24630 [Curtobacterium pusillum]
MWSDLVGRVRTPAVAGALVLGVVVLVTGWTLAAVPEVGLAELGVDRFLIAHVPPTGVAIATTVGMVLEPAGGLLLLVIVGGVVLLRGDLRRTGRFLVVAAVSWLSVEPVKLLVHRPRPVLPGIAVVHESWSYPSGHVALATAIVAGLVTVTAGRARAQVLAVGAVLVVAVAVSRLVLGVHHPSDVAAAAVWAGAVAVVVSALLPRLPAARTTTARHRTDRQVRGVVLDGESR